MANGFASGRSFLQHLPLPDVTVGEVLNEPGQGARLRLTESECVALPDEREQLVAQPRRAFFGQLVNLTTEERVALDDRFRR
jgi:hypothetical protein